MDGLNADASSMETSQTDYRYDPQGTPMRCGARHLRGDLYEFAEDWSVVEPVIRQDSLAHLVHSIPANRRFAFQNPHGTPLTEGRIGFQIEGAQVIFRAMERIDFGGARPAPRVLLITSTAGYRHDSISAAVEALRAEARWDIAMSNRFETVSEVYLALIYAAVVLHTTDDFLDGRQQAALVHFVRNGSGIAAVHGVADAEHGWPCYGELVRGRFREHPAVQEAAVRVVRVVRSDRAATQHLPASQTWTDEGCGLHELQPGVEVLLTVDEATCEGGTMGTPHPVSWSRVVHAGRSAYTSLGHPVDAWTDPQFCDQVAGGIRWVLDAAEPAVPQASDPDAPAAPPE